MRSPLKRSPISDRMRYADGVLRSLMRVIKPHWGGRLADRVLVASKPLQKMVSPAHTEPREATNACLPAATGH